MRNFEIWLRRASPVNGLTTRCTRPDWFSNAESYFLIGDAMGKAMKQMLYEGKK